MATESAAIQSALSISTKGNFKWHGKFEDLQEFINEQLQTQTKWSSPGGNSKLFENEAVKIRWYANTSSLTIKGIDCEQLKDKLRAIARTESDENDAISLIDKNNLDIGIHNEVERSIIIEGEDFSARKLNSSSQVIDLSTQPNQSLICSELVEKIKDLEMDFNIKISALTQEVSSIQNKRKAYANESLLHENRELKDENKSLLQKVANLSFIVSDLNTKLKESENEKQSLVTVLKLVNLDQSIHDQNSHGTWKTQCRSMNKDQHLSTRSQDSEVVTRNAVDVLSDTGGNETNIYDYDDDRSKVDDPSSIATSQRESQRSIADNESSNSRPANKSTKHQQKRHANGSKKSPDQLVEGIVKLVSQVREKSAHIKVAISALTIRKDGHLIQTKVNQTNNLLNSFCSDNNVDFINHTNIDLDCLNRGGLHLNRKGSTIMQRNYMDFLN
ncbi:Hypothetical predicted protein [Paramuricea clavata]|uniref:Uncharacterized protein n=1 Tax=Paramuricea clavata TaxID=317549 RepID=A0A6S7GPG3_PARCT|nr:Hypothetical predicted protein [Paramuricea clavata]